MMTLFLKLGINQTNTQAHHTTTHTCMYTHTHAHLQHTHTHTDNQTHPWVFCRSPDCDEVVYWRVVTISSHLHNCQAIIDKLAIIIG